MIASWRVVRTVAINKVARPRWIYQGMRPEPSLELLTAALDRWFTQVRGDYPCVIA